MLKISSPVETLFIILGEGCNLRCKYCYERNITPQLFTGGNKINSSVYEFIDGQIASQDVPLTIHFYGGEPLLYFDEIEEIVHRYRDNNKVNFALISNAKNLTQEMVEFINTPRNRMNGMTVSWDGNNSIHTRGYDAIRDKWDLLKQIKGLAMNMVISSYNMPYNIYQSMIGLQKEYFELHNMYMGIRIEPVESITNGMADPLATFDEETLSRQLKQFKEKIVHIFQKDSGYSREEMAFAHNFIEEYSKTFDNISGWDFSRDTVCSKGNGKHPVVSIDWKGNLYECHNNMKLIGHLKTMDEAQWRKQGQVFNEITLHAFKTECHKCPAIMICGCGCPFNPIEHKKTSGFCEIRRKYYGMILETIHELTIEVAQNAN